MDLIFLTIFYNIYINKKSSINCWPTDTIFMKNGFKRRYKHNENILLESLNNIL